MERYGLFIDGEFSAAQDGAVYTSINPANGLPWAEFAAASTLDVDRAVKAAKAAHDSGVWRNKTPAERAEILRRIADLISDEHMALVMAEIQDSGGTMRKANGADIMGANMSFGQHAEFCEALQLEEATEEFFPIEATSIVRREPVGVVAAIIPFNFPFAAASWKVAPALAAGCTLVLKPSPLTPCTALMMAKICTEAGVPPGVINVITGPDAELGAALVAHPLVNKVSFTGSNEVGKKVMKSCADRVTNCLLELGGKSATILLDDADLDIAIPGAIFGSFFHSGQVCESGTRLLVPDAKHDEIVARLKQEIANVVVGDPMDVTSTMGPLISLKQLENTERYVQSLHDEGATLVFGGKRPEHCDENGFYYEPTCFTDVRNDMTAACEEIFGPVLVIIRYVDDDHAIRIANDSKYGLGGSIWSRDLERATGMARRIESGTLWINDYHLINPKYPFGGFKQSGIGRELGPQGLDAYFEFKHIHVGRSSSRPEKHYLSMILKEG
ncbi:MAG: aldehyde dehydrogenase family protein [Myxococcota bacterium]|nr:aldehyde dehydrogenase family protein [Myxococcota bacterium]